MRDYNFGDRNAPRRLIAGHLVNIGLCFVYSTFLSDESSLVKPGENTRTYSAFLILDIFLKLKFLFSRVVSKERAT